MRDAMKLIGAGDLVAATAAIQRGLEDPAQQGRPHDSHSESPASYIDAEYRVDSEQEATGAQGEAAPAAQSTEGYRSETGTFRCSEGTRDYLMYAPRERATLPAPVLLMLHGCTQNVADFARGTRMHLRAASEGYVVVYPIQPTGCNANGCWNWFRAEDQQRAGEPAILAGLAAEMTRRFDCDPSRVFV